LYRLAAHFISSCSAPAAEQCAASLCLQQLADPLEIC
jgi:hypothetical protein